MANKPIREGFKSLTLCDSGYTLALLPLSRTSKNQDIETWNDDKAKLSETACSVCYLIEQLPWKNQAFNIYIDNFFSSIPLFAYLYSKEIGAYRTARKNSRYFPANLKVNKKDILNLNWNTKSGVEVNKVLAFFWVDNNAVTMLTTIHKADWEIEQNR